MTDHTKPHKVSISITKADNGYVITNNRHSFRNDYYDEPLRIATWGTLLSEIRCALEEEEAALKKAIGNHSKKTSH